MSAGDPVLGTLARRVGWLVMAEGASRVTRIVTALALAYALEPVLFGVAALAMTVCELMRTPTRCGVLQAVVRADENDLGATMQTAITINWVWHICLALAQIAIAYPLEAWMDAPGLAEPLIVLSVLFFLYPVAFGRIAFLHRAGNMKKIAGIVGATLSLANLATAALALAGFGLWSVVLPRILSALLWIGLAYRAVPVLPEFGGERASTRDVLRYGQSILGSEMLKAAQGSLDKIIIGKLLGMEALGFYTFAFNAGLGLSQSLLKGFSDALFPYLCQSRRANGDYRQPKQILAMTALTALVLFGTQAVLAPVYVPMLFGDRWEPAVLTLALLCLSAITRPFWDVPAQTLRAEGTPKIEFVASIAQTTLLLLATGFGAMTYGIVGAAAGCLATRLATEPLFAFFVFRTREPRGQALDTLPLTTH